MKKRKLGETAYNLSSLFFGGVLLVGGGLEGRVDLATGGSLFIVEGVGGFVTGESQYLSLMITQSILNKTKKYLLK
jgi:hypothetical protein